MIARVATALLFAFALFARPAAATPELQSGGKPFFVYGAAFFYERIPPSEWRRSLAAYKALGINTIDLYLIWNWHEIADGDFDFTGRTSPRRDLHTLFSLIHELGFKIIVRPGPVIRNEWRNGGYPEWLLEQPAYNMPLHDILEGRYPATATLQNTHSDDAAAEWMNNPVHLQYAGRWLRTVLREITPWSGDVLAIALDDDQGAYIDNQTWPAPHFAAYLKLLASIVHQAFSPRAALFINTYQMKVTASSPVWAWGNWYQSDAYAITEHDRAQLEFSTGLLQTQPHTPVMISEFQAGWLQGPDEIRPRAAAPSNTELALGTLLQMGAHGVINFPVQDSSYPAGWEAPFANSFYGWDAALSLQSSVQPRYAPTARIGRWIASYGTLLAQTHRIADAAILWYPSAYVPASLSNDDFYQASAHVIAAQSWCRANGLRCDLVDPRFADDATLRTYPVLLLPAAPISARLDPTIEARLQALPSVKRVDFGGPPQALSKLAHPERRDLAFLQSQGPHPFGFVIATNYSDRELLRKNLRLPFFNVQLARLGVAPRSAAIFPVHLPLKLFNAHFARGDELLSSDCNVPELSDDLAGGAYARVEPLRGGNCTLTFVLRGRRRVYTTGHAHYIVIGANNGAIAAADVHFPPEPHQLYDGNHDVPLRGDQFIRGGLGQRLGANSATATIADLYREGTNAVILENDLVRLIVAPGAGSRAFVFQDKHSWRNIFTSIGSLRDTMGVEPPISPRDYIGKYTHQFPAGTFNRPYTATILESGMHASVKLSYNARDFGAFGAHFERTITLEPHSRTFAIEHEGDFPNDPATESTVLVNTLAVGDDGDAPATTVVLSAGTMQPFVPGHTLTFALASGAMAMYSTHTHALAVVAWPNTSVSLASLEMRPGFGIMRLGHTGNVAQRVRFGMYYADNVRAAQAILQTATGR